MADKDIYIEKQFENPGGLKERLLNKDNEKGRLFDTGYELAAFAAGVGYKLVQEGEHALREVEATSNKNSLTIKIHANSSRADTFMADLFAILDIREETAENSDEEEGTPGVISETLHALKEDEFSNRCSIFNRYVHTGLHYIEDTHHEQNLPYEEVVLRFALDGPFCFETNE